jgi:hypothetical protein
MTTINSLTNVNVPVNIQGMDLETAMMAVQTNRANLLEQQLKSQMDAVQSKNNQIAGLNQALGALNGVVAKHADKKVTDNVGVTAEDAMNIHAGFTAAGMTPPKELIKEYSVTGLKADGKQTAAMTLTPDQFAAAQKDGKFTVAGKTYTLASFTPVAQTLTKGDAEKVVANLKSQIDGMTNSQQMDMLRLQSLSNKRNEAFDIMTNFIKKMQENRSSIIGNLR